MATSKKTMLKLSCALVAFALGGHFVRGVGAQAVGDPSASAPLFYSGTLEEGGVLVDGVRAVQIDILPTSDKGAVPICPSTRQQQVSVTRGRFRVQLSAECAEAFRGARATWIHVLVDNTSMGITQIGAVPYAISASGTPPGAITAFGGTSVPDGWLLCDGSARRSADYPRLAAALGKVWGDGSVGKSGGAPEVSGADFNLPDLRGRFLRGADDGSQRDIDRAIRAASGPNGAKGDTVGSAQESALAVHNHALTDPGHTHPYYSENDGCSGEKNLPRRGPGSCVYEHTSGGAATGITIAASGGSSETRPINAAVRYIVKY